MASITGNKSNNTLSGTEEGDVISGSAGNDVLSGLGGADRLVGGTGNDTLRGGIGNDIYVVDSLLDVVDEESNADTDDVVETGLISVDLDVMFGGSVEHATLTGSTSLNATGNGADNRLTGNGASNALDGGVGNDSLKGGSGNDTLLGGLGNDTLDGGKGNDVVRGGGGNDTYVVNSAGDVVDEEGNIDSNDTVVASISVDLSTLAGGAIENATLTGSGSLKAIGNAAGNALIGNTGNNLLNGAAGNDVLQGLNGRDTLDGGSGADLLSGGSGNDTYVVDDGGDVVDEQGNADATDAVLTSITVDIATLGAGAIENVTLTGTAAIDAIGNDAGNLLNGNSGSNLLDGAGGNDVLQSGGGNDSGHGGAGDDSLDGGTGNDTLKGGVGNDTYVLDSVNDVVDEEGNSDTDDRVKANFNIDLTTFAGGAIEHVTLTGSSSRNATGSGSANNLTGNGGNNILNGSAGNDSLIGNGGRDTLLGGNNDDKLTGGTGNDSIDGGTGDDSAYFSGNLADYQITVGPDGTVTLVDLAPTVNGNDGTDKISNVETVHFLDATLSFGHAPNAPADGDAAPNAIPENAASGTLVGIDADSSDIDYNDSVTYSLVADSSGRFVIDPATGVVSVAAGGVFDSTTEPNVHITVRATDGTGKFSDSAFDITVEPTVVAPLELVINDSINGVAGAWASASGENGGDGGDALFDWSNQNVAGTSVGDTVSIGGIAGGGHGGGGGNGDTGASDSGTFVEIGLHVYETYKDGGDGSNGGNGGNGGDGTAKVTNVELATLGSGDLVHIHLQSYGGSGQSGGNGGGGGDTGPFKEYSVEFPIGGAFHSAGATGGDGGSAGVGGDAGAALTLIDNLQVSTGSGADQITLELYSFSGSGGAGGAGGLAGGGAQAGIAASGGGGGDGGDARSRISNSVVDAGSDDDAIALYIAAGESGISGGSGGWGGSSGYADSYTGGPTKTYYTRTHGAGTDGGNAGAQCSAFIELEGNILEGGDGNDNILLALSGGLTPSLASGGLAGYAGETITIDSPTQLYTVTAGSPGDPGLSSAAGKFVVNITGNTFSGGDGDDAIRVALLPFTSAPTIDFGGNTFTGGTGTDLLTFDGYGGHPNVNEVLGGIDVDLGQGKLTILGQLNAISGIEHLAGTSGNDTLTGDSENNHLSGWLGADTIAGGSGSDLLTGGNGDLDADTFVFALDTSGDDTITEFGKTSDKLSFFDVLDSNGDSILDLSDLEALVDSVVDDGASVLVNFTTGATIVFQSAGTGSVAALSDLVGDASSQILIG